MQHRRIITVLCLGILPLWPTRAAVLSPQFNTLYTLTTVAPPFGSYQVNTGGLTFESGNSGVLLIGGGADNGNGAVDAFTVTRSPSTGSITGLAANPTEIAPAAFIDAGLTYGPGGVLFWTAYPNDTISQLKPGSSSADKTFTPAGVPSSPGGLAFIPAGLPGAGNAVIASYSSGTICSAVVTPDGSGTYNFGTCSHTVSTGSALAGILYVPSGAYGFSQPTVLVAYYAAGVIDAYHLDANGLPDLTTGVPFVTGLNSPEGMTVDPATGDFVISEFHPDTDLVVLHSNAAPEPGTLGLFGAALAGLGWVRRRGRR